MRKHFSVTKRVFENEAVIVFIDLLGTRALYRNGFTETQAKKILRRLLSQFSKSFSKHFKENERKQNFDVSIYADSIVVSPRKDNSAIVTRLVDFSLGYQADLLLHEVPSRVIIVKDSFFSFKMLGASETSILGSQYTTISLCGGKGIQFVEDSQKGLPIGVYVSKPILNELTSEQQKRAVPLKHEKLFFIKQNRDVLNILENLSPKTFRLLVKRPGSRITSIRCALETSHPDKEALKKVMPWLLVHLGRQKEIERDSQVNAGDLNSSVSSFQKPLQ